MVSAIVSAANGLGDRFSRQQGALLMAAWTKAALLTGEGDENLVAAVRAPNAGKAEVQVAAAEEFAYNFADDQSPRAVAFCVALVIGTLEFRIVTLDGPVERRLPRPARAVDGCDLRRQADHGIAAFRFEAGRERNAYRNAIRYDTCVYYPCREATSMGCGQEWAYESRSSVSEERFLSSDVSA